MYHYYRFEIFRKQLVWRVVNALATRMSHLNVELLSPAERADLDVKIFRESATLVYCFGKALGQAGRDCMKEAFQKARRSIGALENKSERDYLLSALCVAARGCGATPNAPENEVDDAIREIANDDERETATAARARALTRRLFAAVHSKFSNWTFGTLRCGREFPDVDVAEERRLYESALARICRLVDELEYQTDYDSARVELLALDWYAADLFRRYLSQDLRESGTESPIDAEPPESFADRLRLYDGALASTMYGVEFQASSVLGKRLIAEAIRTLEEARERLTTGVGADGEPLSEEELDALRTEARGMALYSRYARSESKRLRQLYRALDAFDAIPAQLVNITIDPFECDDPKDVVEYYLWLALAEELSNATKSPSEHARREVVLTGLYLGLISRTTSFSASENEMLPTFFRLKTRALKRERLALNLIKEIDEPLVRIARYAELMDVNIRASLRKNALKLALRLKEEILALESDVTREFVITQYARLFSRRYVRRVLFDLLDGNKRFATQRALAVFRDFYCYSFYDELAEENVCEAKANAALEAALDAVRDDEEPTVEAERILEFTRAVAKKCRASYSFGPRPNLGDEE